MTENLGFFIGVVAFIWVISEILTYLWGRCTKRKITNKVIIASIIIASVIELIAKNSMITVIFIATFCVALIRFPKKEKNK